MTVTRRANADRFFIKPVIMKNGKLKLFNTLGVESITSVNMEHEKIKHHKVIKVDKKDEEETEKEDIAPIDRYKNLHFGIIRKLNVVFFRVYEPPIVTEVFNVNGNVQNLFKCVNIPKGQGLTGAEIRTLIRKYVEENNLKHETDKTKVKLDPQLAGVVLGE